MALSNRNQREVSAKEKEGLTPLKILLIGESAVGKTSLMFQYSDDVFQDIFITTVGIDFKEKLVPVDGSNVLLQIWDTAGQERFQSITNAYLRSAHGIMLCYDVTNRESFRKVDRWINKISTSCDAQVDKILIGNKCDLSELREVSLEDGQALAERYGMPFFETSAKENINVEHAFQHMATIVQHRVGVTIEKAKSSSSSKNVDISNGETGDGNSMCCF